MATLTPPSRAALAVRPLGYILYGALWLLIWLLLVFVAVYVIVSGVQAEALSPESLPIPQRVFLTLFYIVTLAYICVVAPWWILSQALLGFALAGQALSGKYDGEPLSRQIGYNAHRTLEARIETRSTRLITAVGNVGFLPGWRFFASAALLVAGFGPVRIVDSAPAMLIGWLLVIAGLGLTALAVRTRLLVEFKRPWETDGAFVLPEKYYKGLASRERSRATALQKARDAGQAPNATDGPAPTPFDRWATAEVGNALREFPMTKYNARKGVPGALDPAIDLVVSSMNGKLSRDRATELVIEGAAYRGVKPVPVARQPGP